MFMTQDMPNRPKTARPQLVPSAILCMNREKFEGARQARNPFPLIPTFSLGEKEKHLAPVGVENGRGRKLRFRAAMRVSRFLGSLIIPLTLDLRARTVRR